MLTKETETILETGNFCIKNLLKVVHSLTETSAAASLETVELLSPSSTSLFKATALAAGDLSGSKKSWLSWSTTSTYNKITDTVMSFNNKQGNIHPQAVFKVYAVKFQHAKKFVSIFSARKRVLACWCRHFFSNLHDRELLKDQKFTELLKKSRKIMPWWLVF